MTLLTFITIGSSTDDNVRAASNGGVPVIENRHMCGDWRVKLSWDDMKLPDDDAVAYARHAIESLRVEYTKRLAVMRAGGDPMAKLPADEEALS